MGSKYILIQRRTTACMPARLSKFIEEHVHHPAHAAQDEAIAAMVEVMRTTSRKHPSTLFIVGSYHIGKERAYLGAAAILGWKVWCPAAKRHVSHCCFSMLPEHINDREAAFALVLDIGSAFDLGSLPLLMPLCGIAHEVLDIAGVDHHCSGA